MVTKAKKDEVIFQTLAEPILNGDIPIQNTWPDTNGILTVLALCLSGITTLINVYMFYKIRALSAIVLLLQQLGSVKAFATGLACFIYVHSTEPNVTSTFDISTFLSWDCCIFVLLVLNSSLLIYLLYKILYKPNKKLILLEVTNFKRCVFIPVVGLPLCVLHIDIQVPLSISDLEIAGTWYAPILYVKWQGFTVTNNNNL